MSGWASIYNNTRAMLRFQGEALARLQEQAVTGARVNRPSDAPADAFKILQTRGEAARLETYSGNLSDVLDSREIMSNVFQDITTALSRARTLASQAATGTYTASQRQPVASEINSLLEQVVALANTEHRGQRLFGGGVSGEAYTVRREGNQIVGVDYVGGSQAATVPVAPGIGYGAVMVGAEVFRSDDREIPAFLGSTGAAAGDGTSSVRGDAWLTVTHTATTYAAGSGVAAGASAAAGDTLLGSGHTLTLDEPGRTIRLDDGAAVSFTGAETDLQLTNAAGDVVHVDLTAVTAGFSGTVAIQADGTLSIDDGATSVAIDGTTSQAVTDSRTGRILYVNTAAVARTGLEPVRVYGTYDIFEALISVRDAIRAPHGQGATAQTAEIDKAMDALVEVNAGLSRVMTASGSLIQTMSTLKDNMAGRKAVLDGQADATQNADIVDLASDLAQRQVVYQMALTSASRLLSMSLLNYLD